MWTEAEAAVLRTKPDDTDKELEAQVRDACTAVEERCMDKLRGLGGKKKARPYCTGIGQRVLDYEKVNKGVKINERATVR